MMDINERSMTRPSDTIFALLNRYNDGKKVGAAKPDELAKIVTLTGRIFANMVNDGKRNEEDVDAFEREIPSGDYAFVDQKLGNVLKLVADENTAALMNRFYRENSKTR